MIAHPSSRQLKLQNVLLLPLGLPVSSTHCFIVCPLGTFRVSPITHLHDSPLNNWRHLSYSPPGYMSPVLSTISNRTWLPVSSSTWITFSAHPGNERLHQEAGVELFSLSLSTPSSCRFKELGGWLIYCAKHKDPAFRRKPDMVVYGPRIQSDKTCGSLKLDSQLSLGFK